MFSSRLALSLPSQVLFDNGATQTYHYTADGEKWRTVYMAGMLLKDTVDYCGGAIVENGVLKKLLTPVGYVDMSGSTPSYYYYLKDHQGNNRVVVNSNGSVVETNHYYPFGGLFATSTNVQPYKYNGKELDTKKGLNWYDYGARHYDAALGRWHVVDPMAEKYYPYSLYVYCGNNPVRYVDPTGEGWNDALPHLNKIFSVNVSLGMRLGVEVDTPSAKIGVDVNAGSISVGSDGYKLTKGASVGVGIAEIAINTEVFEMSDEISAREKNYSANILGFGVDHSKTEIFDASKEYFEKIKEVSDTETSFTTSIGAAFGIGVDVEIDMVEVKNFFIKLFE